MKTNSHYIQRALLKNIFNTESVFRILDRKLEARNIRSVASSETLFFEDEANEIEKMMNEMFETKVIQIFRSIDPNSNEIKVSHEESFVIRKYFLVTMLRLNLRVDQYSKELLSEILKLETMADYNRRFASNNDRLGQFFFTESHIKFLKHKDIDFIDVNAFMLSTPFDSARTDFNYIMRLIGDSYPCFIIPIFKNLSICFVNTYLTNDSYQSIINLKPGSNSSKWRLNVLNPRPFIEHTVDKEVNGVRSSSAQFAKSHEEFWKNSANFIGEVKSRDAKKSFYYYEIAEISDYDFDILILDTLSKTYGTYSDIINELIFPNKLVFQKWISKMIEIEEYVSLNRPDDVEFWNSSDENKFKHKIWEIMTDPITTRLKQWRSIIVMAR